MKKKKHKWTLTQNINGNICGEGLKIEWGNKVITEHFPPCYFNYHIAETHPSSLSLHVVCGCVVSHGCLSKYVIHLDECLCCITAELQECVICFQHK